VQIRTLVLDVEGQVCAIMTGPWELLEQIPTQRAGGKARVTCTLAQHEITEGFRIKYVNGPQKFAEHCESSAIASMQIHHGRDAECRFGRESHSWPPHAQPSNKVRAVAQVGVRDFVRVTQEALEQDRGPRDLS